MTSFSIAIASNDGTHIAKSHFGDADFFLIYLISESTISEIEKKQNSAKNADEDHASSEKMQMILSLIGNADVLVSKKPSPNFLKIAEKSTVQPVIVDCDEIDKILPKIKSHYSEIIKAITNKQNNAGGEIIFLGK